MISHRKALLKFLNAAHVMQYITVDQFDDVVANITESRYLGFNKAKLIVEGHNQSFTHLCCLCIHFSL